MASLSNLVDASRDALKRAVTSVRERPAVFARSAGIGAFMLAGLYLFYRVADFHQPLADWAFWRFARCWALCAFWGLGCLSTGDIIVRRLLPGRLPLREHLATAFATGVFVFYFLGSLLGLLHVFGKAFFYGVPLLMFAAGARGLARTAWRLRRHLRHARKTIGRPSHWFTVPAVAFGIIGLLMVYFLLLTPDNVQFDSRWKHMALAEQYAVTGGIRRFPEGWTVETNPHLATFVYLFAFMSPFGELWDRVELAAHLEFMIFVVTTLSISALVRKLVPGMRARHVWAVRFLFPGVFLYDSSVSGGADHIAALFTVPMFLLVLRGSRDLSWRYAALVAMMTAGAAMSKLTCLLMFVPVALIVYTVRGGWILIRPPAGVPRRNAYVGALVALGVGLVATSTFWLKNWVFYGDPLYPSLYKYLTLRPWTPDSENLFIWAYKDRFVRPTRDWAGLVDTFKALFTFSFIPNDYSRYHGKVPVFGSLFTLFIPVFFFFARKARRAWALIGSIHLAIFVWYWIHHEDRYLQALLPWMTATTAAGILLAWRSGFFAKGTAALLVSFQLVWGGDVYFIPTHSMTGSAIKKTVDFLAGTYKKDKNRYRTYAGWEALGKKLPKGSRVMLHDNHVHLGIGASTVSDWNAWQFGMSYARHPQPAQTYELMKQMGVTHIVWESQRSVGWDSIAGDLVFFNFVYRASGKRTRVGKFEIVEMPQTPPNGPNLENVLYLGCGRPVRNGLYKLNDLSVPIFGAKSDKYRKPREGGDAGKLVPKADAIVLETKCHKSLPAGASGEFEQVAKRKAMKHFKRARELTLWLRRESSERSEAPSEVDEEAVEEEAPDPADIDEPDDTPDRDNLLDEEAPSEESPP